jgi:hypothetical protein
VARPCLLGESGTTSTQHRIQILNTIFGINIKIGKYPGRRGRSGDAKIEKPIAISEVASD